MDIGSNNSYPSSVLSNFTENHFTFDGIECKSMEGLLQSFKFENENAQAITCGLVGIKAKRKGQKRNKYWQAQQTLWWKGKAYARNSEAYQELLDAAFTALYEQSEKFRKALASAGQNATFTHSIGHNQHKKTVLTTQEFCSRVQRLKDYGEIKRYNLKKFFT